MPNDLEVLNGGDEETLLDSPTDETDEQTDEDTPAAEESTDETGVTDEADPADTTEETDEEGEERGPVPYPRVQKLTQKNRELTDQIAQLTRQQEAISQLVNHHPAVRDAIEIALGRKPQETTETPNANEYVPLDMPAELDPDEPANQAVLRLVNETRRENFELRKQLVEKAAPGEQAAQQLQRQQYEALNTQFENALKPLEEKAGLQITDEEKDRILTRAAKLAEADQADGIPFTLEQKVQEAFLIVTKPRVDKQRKTRETKTALTKPTTVNGKVNGEKQYDNADDLMSDLYDKYYPQ